MIRVEANAIGIVHRSGSGAFTATDIVCANSVSAVAIKQTGGTFRFIDSLTRGGTGPQIWGGDLFRWCGGGLSGPARKYGIGYFGNIYPGVKLRVKRVELIGLKAPFASLEETLARFMGVDEVLIDGCDFDGTCQRNGKEVCQFRHVRKLMVRRSRLAGMLVLGVLRRDDCKSQVEADAYHADAQRYRINAEFDDKTEITGLVRVTGQADVTFNGTRLIGPDPRVLVMVRATNKDLRLLPHEIDRSLHRVIGPINGSNAISREPIAGIAPPTVKINDVVNLGWKNVMVNK